MKHWKIRVYGRVQGVFYRASTEEKAKSLGLAGYVCNMPDGSVYIEAEGSETKLNELVAWCKQGPPLAKVENVKVEEGDLQHYQKFEVRRF
ncbi:MAG: acylphosphatase [Flammeovirgaceae bacterium]|nr:acylphosphatase [Flammeovirgaceae bacterium]MDW8286583.1 acylphosphatase [Flammeovirgaceae bacterium]